MANDAFVEILSRGETFLRWCGRVYHCDGESCFRFDRLGMALDAFVEILSRGEAFLRWCGRVFHCDGVARFRFDRLGMANDAFVEILSRGETFILRRRRLRGAADNALIAIGLQAHRHTLLRRSWPPPGSRFGLTTPHHPHC